MTKEKICGIYCIENLVNGKKYIGLSRDIEKRFGTHIAKLNKGEHINEHLQSAWDFYKEENFSFYVIETCSPEQLAELEMYYINKFQTRNRDFGYNMTDGGDGIKHLDLQCADKISKSETLYPVVRLSLAGDFICEYRNCRIAAEAVNGRTENIRQCCNKAYGYKTEYGSIWMYKHEYETEGCNLSDYVHTSNAKPVIQYDLCMNYIAEYESARDADKHTGIGYKLISRVCNYQRPHTHGYVFRFKYDTEKYKRKFSTG